MSLRSAFLAATPRRVALVASTLFLCAFAVLALASAARATPTFLTALDMSDPGQDAGEPQVAVDSAGETLVVWTRSDGANSRVQARFRDSAGAVGAVDTLSDPGQNASEPQVAFDSSGNAIAVWTRSDGTKARVQAAFRPSGGSWQAPQTLSAAGQDADAPQISFDNTGKAMAVWSRYDVPPTSAVIQAAIRPASGSFGVAQTLSVPGQVAYEPQVAAGADLDNNAAACWTRSDGAKLRVQCARRRDVTGIPRPKGATPLYVSLVNAYNTCAAPNRVHAAPLNFGSCNPPTRASSVLTSGSPDANGFAANLVGSVKLAVQTGDPNTVADEADVSVDVNITDVRNNPSGTDYTGKVLATAQVKITDNKNADENPETGTVQAFSLGMPVNCNATTDTTIGANCSLSTTVDALLPGAVIERSRGVWELGQFEVKDAGPNGTGYGAGCPPTCGDGDEGTFLRQGVFAP
jgi:hypothetical protein